MTTLVAVKVVEVGAIEAVKFFQKCAKLKSGRLHVNREVLQILGELRNLALAIKLAGSYVVATPRLISSISVYLPEYRERRKQLLGMVAMKLISVNLHHCPMVVHLDLPSYHPL